MTSSGNQLPRKCLTEALTACREPLVRQCCWESREKASRARLCWGPLWPQWGEGRTIRKWGQRARWAPGWRGDTSEKPPQRSCVYGHYQATWPKRSQSRDRAMCQELQKAHPFIPDIHHTALCTDSQRVWALEWAVCSLPRTAGRPRWVCTRVGHPWIQSHRGWSVLPALHLPSCGMISHPSLGSFSSLCQEKASGHPRSPQSFL